MVTRGVAQRGDAVGRAHLARRLARAWMLAYLACWVETLLGAAIVALLSGGVSGAVRGLLELTLSARTNPPPSLGCVAWIAAHNIPIFCWPLLLPLLNAHGSATGRHAADALVAACFTANVGQVALALGAYGTALLPYIPQLPLEWAGAALGLSAWLLQRHRPLSVRSSLLIFTATAAVLLAAAVLETVAVPYR